MAKRGASPRTRDGSAAARPRLGAGSWAALFAAFLGAALVLYGPALRGPFLSDDQHYVAHNGTIQDLSPANVLSLFDPTGPATLSVVNYAPLQLLLHGVAWQAFGAETTGHHVLNVVLHALASLLLAALFLQTGIPLAGALLGAVFFLVHPANVEAVAWISQLKSPLALVLSLGALLAWRRHPALATGLFAASLLAKPTAAYALAAAPLLDWTRRERVRWPWIAAWAALFAGYAVAEFATHQRSGAADAELHGTPLVLLRTVAAIGARYLVMSVSSAGVSTFHEPEPALSPLDPWWLASLPLAGLLLWRLVVVWRRRDVETVYWVWAGVSFAPVSQIFPFLYPMADRYLYFILPGLLGGVLLMGREALERLFPAGSPRRGSASRVVLGLSLVLLGLFAVRSVERARVWRSGLALLSDAAEHYPEGVSAELLRAKRAAQLGDADQVAAALRRASDRGYRRFEALEMDPAYAGVRDAPAFRAVVAEMAAHWIESGLRKPDPTQAELRSIAHAYVVRGELREGLEFLERAAEAGGPASEDIRAEIQAIRMALEAGAPERVRLGITGSR